MRRSAERDGGPEGLVSLGTITWTGMSGGVCSDICAGLLGKEPSFQHKTLAK